MRFNPAQNFTIEIEDKELKGLLYEPTKAQSKQMADIIKADSVLSKEITKVSNKIELVEAKLSKDTTNEKIILELQKLKEELENLGEKRDYSLMMDEVSKLRIETTMKSDQSKEIIELCEQYGYYQVFECIRTDIEEKKKVDSKS